jgi:hypothetical protein
MHEASSPGMMSAETRRNGRVESHLLDLHKKLKITDAQEPQWRAIADVMRANASAIDELMDKREAHKTAIDDLNAYGAMAQAHADGIKKLSDVFTPLYASMSDAQKKMADDAFVHPMPHKR